MINCEIRSLVEKISGQLKNHIWSDSNLHGAPDSTVRSLVEAEIRACPESLKRRILDEYFGLGPIRRAMEDPSVTEILLNGPKDIWVERDGRLEAWDDEFYSDLSFNNFVQFICRETRQSLSWENPFVSTAFGDHRVHMSSATISAGTPNISIRKHRAQAWSLDSLRAAGWCNDSEFSLLQQIIKSRKNILVVGPTGAGKTSALNALLATCRENERVVIVEDTAEIHVPNRASTKLITRDDPNGRVPPVTLKDLVRQSLRMRPDRIAVGEVRGAEATDLLMALSTGHSGSMGTLHASSPQEALIRLEMLIQMGAPHWSLEAVRRLISLCLQVILVAGKDLDGKRSLLGIYRLASLETFGFTIEKMNQGYAAVSS